MAPGAKLRKKKSKNIPKNRKGVPVQKAQEKKGRRCRSTPRPPGRSTPSRCLRRTQTSWRKWRQVSIPRIQDLRSFLSRGQARSPSDPEKGGRHLCIPKGARPDGRIEGKNRTPGLEKVPRNYEPWRDCEKGGGAFCASRGPDQDGHCRLHTRFGGVSLRWFCWRTQTFHACSSWERWGSGGWTAASGNMPRLSGVLGAKGMVTSHVAAPTSAERMPSGGAVT